MTKLLPGLDETKNGNDINVGNLENNDGLSSVDSTLKRVLHSRIKL
jgi:hypothetical protein